MSDQRTYISVMTPAASDGSFNIQLETFNAELNATFVAVITGIGAGDSEISMARAIQDQLNVLLSSEGFLYLGVPRISSEELEATWQVTRTDHVVCIWSECNFDTSVSSTTGCIVRTCEIGCLLTNAQALRLAVPNAVTLVSKTSGAAFTAEEIADVVQSASAELCGNIRNNIVLSTYLGEFRGKDTTSIMLRPLPLYQVDNPRVRFKNGIYLADIQWSKNQFNKIKRSGEIANIWHRIDVRTRDPYSMDNEVRISFVAGENHIPIAIQKAVLLLSEMSNNDRKGLRSLGGGSLSVTWAPTKEQYYFLYQPIRMFIMGKM